MTLPVLVCGGRDWDDPLPIWRELDRLLQTHGTLRVIEGCAAGADRLAGAHQPDGNFPGGWAWHRDMQARHFPAEWDLYGRAAGPIRNAQMLTANPLLVLAFHPDIERSKGTKDMVARARRVGLRVEVFDR